jgi:hypothetical protein
VTIFTARSGPSRLMLVRTNLESGSTRAGPGCRWRTGPPTGCNAAARDRGRVLLEFPAGRARKPAAGSIQNVKVSAGDHVAFSIAGGPGATATALAISCWRMPWTVRSVRAVTSLAGLGWSPTGGSSVHCNADGLYSITARRHAQAGTGRSCVSSEPRAHGCVARRPSPGPQESQRRRAVAEGTPRNGPFGSTDDRHEVISDGRTLVFGEEGEAGGPWATGWPAGGAPPSASRRVSCCPVARRGLGRLSRHAARGAQNSAWSPPDRDRGPATGPSSPCGQVPARWHGPLPWARAGRPVRVRHGSPRARLVPSSPRLTGGVPTRMAGS